MMDVLCEKVSQLLPADFAFEKMYQHRCFVGSKYTCDNYYNLLANCILSESVRVHNVTSCAVIPTRSANLGNFHNYVSRCVNKLLESESPLEFSL